LYEGIQSKNNCGRFYSALKFFYLTKEINIISVFLIIIIGLIGNVLAITVFIQKRFRRKSTEVFFLVLAISDGLFLLTHFFEDTLRTYIDFYIHRNRSLIPFPYQHCNIFNVTIIANAFNRTSVEKTSIFEFINIADKFVTTCRLVNYFRYFLRFISAYIITVFTIQRTISIYNPIFQNQFSSPKLAWKIIVGLLIVGTILCLFVPFFFNLKKDSSNAVTVVYCDINNNMEKLYFKATIAYVIIIMFIPITTIFISNSLIILQIYKARKHRQRLFKVDRHKRQIRFDRNSSLIENTDETTNFNNYDNNHHFRIFHKIADKKSREKVKKSLLTLKFKKFQNDSQKVTRILVIMSLSFAILNLPYFVAWSMFFYNEAFKQIDKEKDLDLKGYVHSKYFFGFINIAEIIYVLNYGIHFFIYIATAKQFKKQLRVSFCLSE
jgi:hypothetical protein